MVHSSTLWRSYTVVHALTDRQPDNHILIVTSHLQLKMYRNSDVSRTRCLQLRFLFKFTFNFRLDIIFVVEIFMRLLRQQQRQRQRQQPIIGSV